MSFYYFLEKTVTGIFWFTPVFNFRSESFVRDADLHGTSYAKWKRKMVKQMGDENSSEEDDINEVDEFWNQKKKTLWNNFYVECCI